MKRALAAVCSLLCLVVLSGCHSHRPLKLPEVISLQKEIQEMPVVSSSYWNMVHGTKPEEVKEDKKVWH